MIQAQQESILFGASFFGVSLYIVTKLRCWKLPGFLHQTNEQLCPLQNQICAEKNQTRCSFTLKHFKFVLICVTCINVPDKVFRLPLYL